MSNPFKDSELVLNSVKRAVQDNELYTNHAIEITQILFNYLNLQPLSSKGAENVGLSYNGLKKKVNNKKCAALYLNGNKFVSI